MTSILEKTVAIIAPHACIVCGNYNNIVCADCVAGLARIETPFCVRCGAKTVHWRPCSSCAPQSALDAVWVHSYYDGTVATLLHRFKFDHARDAYKPLAQLITTPLPHLAGFTVVPVPTIAPHIRQRSYDHTKLIAKEVARTIGLPFALALERTKNRQQIGSTRAERQEVAASIGVRKTPPHKVLLVDDVCTTGSTLEACAAALKQAGTTEVVAAVAAWQPPKLGTRQNPTTPGTKKDR